MMLYTWKDTERELLLNKAKWGGVISDTEIYIDEVIIHLKEGQAETSAKKILSDILGKKYDGEKILLDLSDEYLDVSFVISKRSKKLNAVSSCFVVSHVIPGASISASIIRSFRKFSTLFSSDHALTKANKDSVRPTPPLYE